MSRGNLTASLLGIWGIEATRLGQQDRYRRVRDVH